MGPPDGKGDEAVGGAQWVRGEGGCEGAEVEKGCWAAGWTEESWFWCCHCDFWRPKEGGDGGLSMGDRDGGLGGS